MLASPGNSDDSPITTPSAGPDAARSQGRFVWPPIKVPVEIPAVPPSPATPASSESVDHRPDELRLSPRTLAPDPRRVGPVAAWWRQVEDTWLLPVSPPLDVRIERLGWHPDPPGAACDRCGTTVGTGESTSGIPEFGCSACREVALPWDRFVRLGEYHAHLADWVQETKFSRCHWLGESLGIELARHLINVGALGNPANTKGVCVVPVATSLRRRLARGIDHAGCVARGVARELNCPLIAALHRAHRPTQRGLSPTAREANVAGAFSLRSGIDLTGRTVILVDDVRTTGATLREAARAVMGTSRRRSGEKRHQGKPARLIVAVLAVTPDPARKTSLQDATAQLVPEAMLAG